MGVTHFTVDGIYTQWAMHSSKPAFGANAGGTIITNRHFSVPAKVFPEKAETVVRTMASHDVTNIGDYFVLNVLAPTMDALPEHDDITGVVATAFNRMFG